MDPSFITQVLSATFAGPSFQSHSRISNRAIHGLSVDIYMVAIGLRQACLIENITLEAIQLDSVISSLRNASPLFQHVLFLYEPSTSQSFVLNVIVFGKNCEESLSTWTTYVQVSEPICTTTPPRGVTSLIEHITRHVVKPHDPLPTYLILPSTSFEVMVPLAGYLLEYPVSYIPWTDRLRTTVTGGFLCGVPLSVFRVILVRFHSPKRKKTTPSVSNVQSLFQFSCPVVLNGQVSGLDPASIIGRIKKRWEKRILDLEPSSMWDDIRVSVERKTFDRVVL